MEMILLKLMSLSLLIINILIVLVKRSINRQKIYLKINNSHNNNNNLIRLIQNFNKKKKWKQFLKDSYKNSIMLIRLLKLSFRKLI